MGDPSVKELLTGLLQKVDDAVAEVENVNKSMAVHEAIVDSDVDFEEVRDNLSTAQSDVQMLIEELDQ